MDKNETPQRNNIHFLKETFKFKEQRISLNRNKKKIPIAYSISDRATKNTQTTQNR
jgi:hypothetical protein